MGRYKKKKEKKKKKTWKETPRCFYFLGEKRINNKSTVKYLNLECDNVGLEWKLQFRCTCILQEK